MAKTLPLEIRKFLEQLLDIDGGLAVLNSTEQGTLRTLLNAADHDALAGKQATLVSGTHVKTLNNQSIVGSGDLTLAAIGAASAVSPNLTAPTCNTAATGTNNTLIATTAFVQNEVPSLQTSTAYGFANPNADQGSVPQSIVIAGPVTDADTVVHVGPIVLPRQSNLGVYNTWGNTEYGSNQDDEFVMYYDGTEWNLDENGDIIANKVSAATTPLGLTGWTTVGGGADLVITAGPITATHIGQLCKATTAWWQWDGAAWLPRVTLLGEPILWDVGASAFYKQVVTSGVVSYALFYTP